MGLLPWIQETGLWLCLQHHPPLPSQFLLNHSLQMSISFCKGQAVVSSSRGLREKTLRMMPSAAFYSILLWLSNLSFLPCSSLTQPPTSSLALETVIEPAFCNQFQTAPMFGRSIVIQFQYKNVLIQRKQSCLGTTSSL